MQELEQKPEKSIKIFVTYNDKHQIIESDIVKPIQTGRAIADEVFEGMIGDDTGDNISKENEKYCELTAQYWTWKNYDKIGNPDYIGFMHYRRHFLFAPEYPHGEETWLNKSNYYLYDYVPDDYIEKNLNSSVIKDCIKDYDVIVPKAFDFRNHFAKTKRENYSKLPGQYVENYDLLLTTVKNMYPEYDWAVEKFKKSNTEWLCNMFIMKKSCFFEYSEFCFSVLQKINELVNSTHYTKYGLRFLGYLGEFLLNIFLLQKIKTNKILLKELDMAMFSNMPEKEYIEPVFAKNYAAVAIPCSNMYAPYLSVWLQSVIDSSSNKNNYDIVVLQDDISEKNQKKLLSMIESYPNFSLRFFNPQKYLDKSKIAIQKKYLSSISSYRVTLNKFMKGYHKVVVAEVDMIFQRDIKDLYDTDIKDAPIAAVIDPHFIRGYNISISRKNYASEELCLTDIYSYVNTGVMIFNIDEFNKNNYSEKLIDMLMTHTYLCLEQDAMNSLFNQKNYLLDAKWNFLTCDERKESIDRNMPVELYKIWQETSKDPYVIHWTGSQKPWNNAEEYLAFKWWKIARVTPYYETIVAANLVSVPTVPANVNYPIVVAAIQKKNIYLKYLKYRILQNFARGKKKDEYGLKKKKFREQYKNVTNFIRKYKNV